MRLTKMQRAYSFILFFSLKIVVYLFYSFCLIFEVCARPFAACRMHFLDRLQEISNVNKRICHCLVPRSWTIIVLEIKYQQHKNGAFIWLPLYLCSTMNINIHVLYVQLICFGQLHQVHAGISKLTPIRGYTNCRARAYYWSDAELVGSITLTSRAFFVGKMATWSIKLEPNWDNCLIVWLHD